MGVRSKKDPMKCTLSEIKFCHHLFEHGNAAEAYRHAYNTTTDNIETQQQEGSRIRNRPQVSAMLDQLMNDRAQRLALTADKMLLNAENINQLATQAEKYGDATAALRLLMEKSGLFREEGEKLSNRELVMSAEEHALVKRVRETLDCKDKAEVGVIDE